MLHLSIDFGVFCTVFFISFSKATSLINDRRIEYDYIVVGAGTTGSVVASRLSEDSDKTVLLLEAGGHAPNVSEIPAMVGVLQGGQIDWGYYTEPQDKACLGLHGKRSYWPRGKALGGTSVLNGMLYVRGNKQDYDNWARRGARGWSYDELLYYFIKSEDQRNPQLANNGYHREGGLQTVTTNRYSTPLLDAFLQAGRELGYPIVDYNGKQQSGFAEPQVTVRDGLRCSSAKAFLRPASRRSNLHILPKAHVTKILFDEGKRARAVTFSHEERSYTVHARREIILSAGVIGSPQILMLSGIGPKEHLQELGIPVVADLPVGKNLQDHVATGGLTFLLNDSVSFVSSRDYGEQAYMQLIEGRGPLSVAGGVQTLAFVGDGADKDNWPDVQLIFFSGLFIPLNSLKARLEEQLLNTTKHRDMATIVPIGLHPKCRGYIRLKSRDPFEYPIIDPNYLCNEEDMETLVQGAKIARRIMRTPSIRRYDPKPFPGVVEGCENFNPESEEYLRCVARTLTYTTHHQCGTCKMGHPKDPSTVVDPELRVKGVKGLRVADASIMPIVTSGNTNAPCIMIGEKAADMIRGRRWDPEQRRLITLPEKIEQRRLNTRPEKIEQRRLNSRPEMIEQRRCTGMSCDPQCFNKP